MSVKKRINFEELFGVEEIVSTCASSALRYARLSPGWKEGHHQSLVDENTIKKLMNCYENSNYGYKVDKENATDRERDREILYCKYVESNFREYIEENLCPYCESQRHFDLILPIVFFSLIIQNEAYSESISRRALKIEKDGVKSSPWKFKNPYKSELYQLNNTKKEKARFQKYINLLKNSEEIHTFCNFDVAPQEIRDAIKSTIELDGEYDRIRYLSEHARAGLFLYDLLTVMHDDGRAIDTLLRLYMAGEFYDLCFFQSDLKKVSFGKKQARRKESLLALYIFGQPLTEEDLDNKNTAPLCFICTAKSLCATEYLAKRIRKRDIYSNYYDYLYTSYDWTSFEFIDYFLNPENLRKYIGLEQRTIKFAKQAIQCAKMTQYMRKALLLADVPSDICALLKEVDSSTYIGFL